MSKIKKSRHYATLLCSILVVIVLTLSGCKDDDRVEMSEEIIDLEFSTTTAAIDITKKVRITTEKQTLIWTEKTDWGNPNITYVKSDTDQDMIVYEKDGDGKMHNKEIHLSEDGLKKYSKQYADEYNKTLTVKEGE